MGRYVPTYIRRDDCHIDLSPGGVRLFVSSGRMKQIVMLSGTGGRLVMDRHRHYVNAKVGAVTPRMVDVVVLSLREARDVVSLSQMDGNEVTK